MPAVKDLKSRREAIWRAARAKWGEHLPIAVTELRGVWTIKVLTGRWTLDTSVTPPVAREASDVLWTGGSVEEAEAAVGLKSK